MAVYFIQAGGRDGYIKIGVAKSVTKRLANLQSASPFNLKLLHCIDGGEEVERQMLDRFARYRLRGEWFVPSTEILDFCGVARPRPSKPRRAREPNAASTTASDGMPPEILEDIERYIYANPIVLEPDTPRWMVKQHEQYMAGLYARFGSRVAIPVPPASNDP